MTAKPEPKPSGKNPQGQDEESESHKILARIHELKTLLTNKKPDHETEKPKDTLEHKRNRRPLWVTAGITLTYCIVSGAQWLALRRSNDINHDALVSVQRAFISYPTVDVKASQDKNTHFHQWQFAAMAENTGNTPAKRIRAFFDMGYDSTPTEEAFRGNIREKPVFFSGPKHQLKWGGHTRTDQEVFAKTIPDNEQIPVEIFPEKPHKDFFWGWIVYKDQFPDTPWHLTEFCYQLKSIEVFPTWTARTNATACEDYNCDDEDCKNYQDIVEWATAKE